MYCVVDENELASIIKAAHTVKPKVFRRHQLSKCSEPRRMMEIAITCKKKHVDNCSVLVHITEI